MDKIYTVQIVGLGEFTGTKEQIRALSEMIFDSAQSDFELANTSSVPHLFLEDFDRKINWSADLNEFIDNL